MNKIHTLLNNSPLKNQGDKINKIYNITIKDINVLVVDFYNSNNEKENHHVYAFVIEDNKLKVIGEASFELKEDNICDLHEILLNDINYQGKGIGTSLIEYIEYIAYTKKKNKIIGRYKPFGILQDKTPIFYSKHNYEIIKKHNFRYVIKELNKDSIANNSYYNNKHRSIRRK